MHDETKANSLFQLLLKKEQESANRVYLRQPRNGVWHEYTWAEVMLQARKVARFLHQLKLKKGSHVSIISKNCAEWFITDFGIHLAGMVNVPLFANQNEDSARYVLHHGDVKVVFIGKLDRHQQVRQYIPEGYITVNFNYHSDLKVDYTWAEVMAYEPLVDLSEPGPDDLYTIIYSSGTSGSPKGAMYPNKTIANYLTLFPKDLLRVQNAAYYKLISYLPLAHIYERSAIELASLTIDCDVSFVESLEKFAENLKEIQPTFFTAVPRIWGVFKQKIEQKLPPAKLNLLLKIPFISSLIKKKIIHNLGLNECLNAFSGASHLPVPMIEFFEKIGINIQEGYGQTENLAYATLTLLNQQRKGYVGTPRLDVAIKLGEDSELLIHSPCLMSGYYKDKQASKNAFFDGWLRTGDVAEIDAEQRVKILGRLSEHFKNQTGEFVAPSPIEKRFTTNNDIDQLCLVGRGLPTNVLLITLTDAARLNKNRDKINQSLQHSLHRVNEQLMKFEKVSHIIVLKDAWSTNNDMLTPTLKVKRRVVEQKYERLIEDVLLNHQAIVWES
ncbi:AMP-binding protein [Legionella worsleiensis]|uniref:AMP-binding protein n=1 Tax=Legionella worsleiensis TaxID=45076 RepID=A0A0W1A932_9GAMM|nr:AMP-binding protein [Legionella worsleiensis]KTD77861.1 AMP-binding protein [Legionella worsleiensis]STY33106.1 long-chain fatty-acid-CoA ligase [Legionella worsleiensis]